MALTKEDLRALLAHATNGKKTAVVLTPHQWDRLEKAGLAVASDQKLNEEGRRKAESVKRTLERLRRGVPFAERKKTDPKRLASRYALNRDLYPLWVTSSVANKVFTTNREVMIFGPPDPWMAANKQKGLGEKVLHLFREMGKREYVEVAPEWFQTDGQIEPETSYIWLRTPDTSDLEPTHACVQTHYFDYLMERFPTAKIYAAAGAFQPIQFRVTNKGISKLGIVCILMPMRVGDDWPVPGGADA